jgi:hypothetical protein
MLNVEVTDAARLYRAASVWTPGYVLPKRCAHFETGLPANTVWH